MSSAQNPDMQARDTYAVTQQIMQVALAMRERPGANCCEK
jgi:hypothetical protein